MKEICAYDKCTGCSACVNICAHKSIVLKENIYGELHPEIDQSTCVDCRLCKEICPNNENVIFYQPLKCFASWVDDAEKRKRCASGGIGTIFSEYVIKNNGIVFGSKYDCNLYPIMAYTDSLEELEYFKGSRYVQSVVGNDTFQSVRKFLSDGRLVLFIGTPCQVAGLIRFLGEKYANLITVDLICHGVCPTSFFLDEISFLSKKYKLHDIVDARFRGNDGNDYFLSLWDKKGAKLFPRNNIFKSLSAPNIVQQYYIKGFLGGITLRESCYCCDYSRPERISDITIGDFIGLGKKVPFDFPTKNVSSVIVNTENGLSFYQQVLLNFSNLISVERKYQERLQYKPSLVHPFERSPKNYSFKKTYLEYGYVYAIRKVLKKELREEHIRHCIRKFLKVLHHSS